MLLSGGGRVQLLNNEPTGWAGMNGRVCRNERLPSDIIWVYSASESGLHKMRSRLGVYNYSLTNSPSSPEIPDDRVFLVLFLTLSDNLHKPILHSRSTPVGGLLCSSSGERQNP